MRSVATVLHAEVSIEHILNAEVFFYMLSPL